MPIKFMVQIFRSRDLNVIDMKHHKYKTHISFSQWMFAITLESLFEANSSVWSYDRLN